MIMGIFSSDSYNDAAYRKRHRTLLNDVWKDPRTCSVHDFIHTESVRNDCQLLYTFIIGASPEPDAPTERVDSKEPLTLPKIDNPTRDDVNDNDVTLLNIRCVS
jgi:hypothetical protein